MKKETYRCLDGTVTTSVKKYLKSWKDVIKPFEKEFDMICTGFDPTISFRTKSDNGNWQSIQLPTNLVIAWNKKIADLKAKTGCLWDGKEDR